MSVPSMGATGSSSRDLTRCGAVIVAHARTDLAHECAVSLRRWLSPLQIVVVLNVPDGLDGALIARLEEHAKVVSPPRPQGYGANLNFGVDVLGAGIEFLVLANDDVVFEDESLPRLVAVLEADDGVGLVGPRLRNTDGTDAPSFSSFHTLAGVIQHTAILPGPLWRAQQRRAADSAATSGDEVDWIVGAAMVVRASSFHAVGGFDEDFFLYFEETDLCFRLSKAGWRVAWCPEAIVVHEQGVSIPLDVANGAIRGARRVYFRKRLGPVRWGAFELMLTLLFVAGALYSLIAGLLRPRTARHRCELVHGAWRTRIFLVRSQRDPAKSRARHRKRLVPSG